MVGRPSRRAGSGWEACRWAGVVRRPYWRVLSVRKLKWLKFPNGGPGVIGRPSQRAKDGREAIPEGREWSGGPNKGPGVVVRPSRRVDRLYRRDGSGRESLMEGWA